ncbi:MAG: HEAT repeat domain-containing protein [Nannocystis sp.]|nr:HEAT repeat domain-containing protein [Nannocystis sp.]MBA3548011.1 HEAT repeat domain-containing protein [Nannocystis sp.]
MVRLPLSSSLALFLLACTPHSATAAPASDGPTSSGRSPAAAAQPPAPATPPPIASTTPGGTKQVANTPGAGANKAITNTPGATSPRPPLPRPEPPKVDWQSRVAIAIEKLQTEAPELLTRLGALQPTRSGADGMLFTQPELHDPRAAPILLQRLLAGADPVKVRCAIVDALPATGGDWQEGAAALIAVDSSAKVRKQLVEVMRYAGDHAVQGLRLGFKDEDPEINIAAARTAGFSRQGPQLLPELYSSTFDTDWDLRAAAVQALGMLKLPQSRDVLIKALADESRDVRLQALLALEQLDPEGLLELPELERLAHDRKSHRIARKAMTLLQKHQRAAKARAKAKAKADKAAKASGGDPPPLLAVPSN